MSDAFSNLFHNNNAVQGERFIAKPPGAEYPMMHSGKPPLPWGQYEPDIEPGSAEAIAEDVRKNKLLGSPADQAFIQQMQGQPEGSQITDQAWIGASKRLYHYMNPKSPPAPEVETPSGVIDIYPGGNPRSLQSGPAPAPGAGFTDEDYANWGVNFMSKFNYNITGMLIDVNKLSGAPSEVAASMYYMMETADRDGMLLENFTRGFSNFMTDPTTYVGLSTLGIGMVGTQSGKQLSSMAFKEVLKNIVMNRGGAAGMVVGAESMAYSGIDNAARQGVKINAGQQDEANVGETALSLAAGFVLGNRLSAALPGGIEVVKRGAETVKNVVSAVGDELTLGAMYSNPVFALFDAAKKAYEAAPNDPVVKANYLKLQTEREAAVEAGEIDPNPTPEVIPTLVQTEHPGAPRAREIADARIAQERLDAETNVKAGKKPKSVKDVVKIEDLAQYFEEDHLAMHGRKLDPTDPADQQVAARAMAAEIDLQMTQAASGAGWYDADVLKTFQRLSEIPGLERMKTDETARIIWSAMAAPTSINQLVKNNTRAATAAALTYFRTGKFPIEAPKPDTVTEGIPKAGWGMYGVTSVEPGMKIISHLIEKLGEDGFADWWLSPHTKGELTAIRRAVGLSGGPSGVSGKADSIHLGAMVLGDKTGRFSLNINGYEGTTKDVWYSRTYNRAFGQMFGPTDKKTGKPVVQGGPRNQTERREMEAFNKLVLANTQAKDLSEADAQAILWFYEQGLFTRLGVTSRPGSFSEGVGEIHGTLGVRPTVRGSDGVETEVEPGTTLDGFRGVKPKQRAVRSQRRSVLSEFNTGADGQAPSGPYAGRPGLGSGGNEENGLLAFVPDPAASARYNAAGLTIPKINQVDAASSAQAYHDDMVAAMSVHRFGAQVEIKSPEDLATMRTFRTEGGGGFAIKNDGDVVAVFGSQSEEGSGYAILQAAVEAGGRKLDAFNTFLPDIYESVGFRPVARMPWNDEFAPPDWDKNVFAKYQNGEPDIVFFVHDPEYFGDMNMNDVPLLTDYDAAVALQDKALAELGGGE